MNPPPILFSPSASLTSSFLLPSTSSSLLTPHGSGGMFTQDGSQSYMDMPNMVDSFQMHGNHSSFSQAVQYPYFGTSPTSTSTPTKTAKRKHTTTEKKEDSSPNSIPKCTRCNESASWRHDKRRWWCKECKKAFTPGISKLQASSPPQIQQTQQQQQQQMQAHQQWDQALPNSSQNTPPSAPQNPNQVTPVSYPCPQCGGQACWRHDKKRWFCKDCKKPFTPPNGDIPSSPTSPTKSKKAKSKKTSPSLQNSQAPLQMPTHMSSNQLPSFHTQMPFLPPLNQKDGGMPLNLGMQMRAPLSTSPNGSSSIPSPSSIIMSQPSITSNMLTSNGNLSPTNGNTPKKPIKKKEKDSSGNEVQVLVTSLGGDNSLNGDNDWQKMSGSVTPSKFMPLSEMNMNKYLA
eukprot:gene7903-9279_t